MYTSSSLKEMADKSKGHGAFCQSDHIGFWTHGGIAKHPLKLPAEGAQIRQTERKKTTFPFHPNYSSIQKQRECGLLQEQSTKAKEAKAGVWEVFKQQEVTV